MSFEITFTIHASDKYLISNTQRSRGISSTQGQGRIGLFRSSASLYVSSESLSAAEKEKKRYQELKLYFKNKIQSLGITKPLINYEDDAFKIELGYTPKEVEALFGDFINGNVQPSYADIFGLRFSVASTNSSPSIDFNERFIDPDYQKKLDLELQSILNKSNDIFKNVPSFDCKPIQTNASEERMIKLCLQNNNGLVIGEVHEHQSPKLFLIENIDYLKREGVTTIYLEHLLYERHQKMLAEYVSSPQNATMPIELEVYLKHLDNERELIDKGTFYNLVKSAKQAGLRIIAIDTQAIYKSNYNNPGSGFNHTELQTKRYLAMNSQAVKQITTHNDGGKFVALVGSGHVYRCKDVPGICDILQCPGIVIRDIDNKEDKPNIQLDVAYPDEQVTLGTVYTRSQNHNLYDIIPFKEDPESLANKL